MPPTITAFAASPDRGRGLARDMQVRWALEEVVLRCSSAFLREDEGARAPGAASFRADSDF